MKKTKGLILMGMLMLVAVGAYLTAGTYAKYTSTVDATGTAAVAKWNFTAANTLEDFTFDLEQVVDASSLANDRIAPGTSGSIPYSITNAGTEVAVDLELSITNDGNTPTNMKYYFTRVCTGGTANGEETSLTACTAAGGEFLYSDEVAGTKTAVLAANETTPLEGNIYWVWPYVTGEAPYTDGDTNDTSDGIAATSTTITVSIKGTQKAPGAAVVSSTTWN